MRYIIGLDMGINNVGWSIYDKNQQRILKSGVRMFSVSNLAADRRNFRNTRRRMKRKENRVKDTKYLLSQIAFPTDNTIDDLLIEKRVKGLNEKISKQDITNILCYMMSHRGYIPFGDEEVRFVDLDGKLPCEYYYGLYKSSGKYRALEKTVKNSENLKEIETILKKQQTYYPEITDIIIEKIKHIFLRKREFWEGPGSLQSLTPYGRYKTAQDVENYIANKNENSNYEKYIFEDLVGKCKISINEKCASKLNFYAEEFNMLNDFINISFKSLENMKNSEYIRTDKNSHKLNRSGLEAIIDYCINNEKATITKLLKEIFATKMDNLEHYRVNKNGKPQFSTLKNYRLVKRTFHEEGLSPIWLDDLDKYNQIINILTICPNSLEARKMLSSKKEYNLSDDEIEILIKLFSKFKADNMLSYHSLSETVLKRAIEDMKKYQLNFMQVRKKLDYDKEAREYFQQSYNSMGSTKLKINKEFVDDIFASPQVKKSLRQAIMIINKIIEEQKELPQTIVIESTKELNSTEKKAEIEKEQRLKEKLRKEAAEYLESTFGSEAVTEVNIEKVILYNESGGRCAYCDTQILMPELLDRSLEKEHILPISKSFDNSYDNKILSCRKCNADKGDLTPLSFVKNKEQSFIEKIKNNPNLSEQKKQNLLFDGDLNKYKTRFFHRNLRDTAYATTELIEQIKHFNDYLGSKNISKINTISMSGKITSDIRRKYNLPKKRDEKLHDVPFHHAVDAAILASVGASQLGEKITFAQNNSAFWIQQDCDKQLEIMSDMLSDFNLSKEISDIKNIENDKNFYYSSQVNKSMQSSIANQNIYKIIKKENDYYRIDQVDNIYNCDMKKPNIQKLFDRLFDENDDTIRLMCFDNDKALYKLLKDIYIKYKNFRNPFIEYAREINNLKEEDEFDYQKHGIHVPSSKRDSPLVKRLRYYTVINEPYLIEKDSIKKKELTYIAYDSLTQYCTRVYLDLDKNEFVFLPVYRISIDLNNNKINEHEKYYKKLFEKYIAGKKITFITDIYNGEFLQVTKKDGTILEGYYKGFDKTNTKATMKNGNSFTRSDQSLTIYDYDIIGNRYKRLTFNKK